MLPETSLVLATTYNVPVEESITGVLVIPNSGVMVAQSPWPDAASAQGIAVTPAAGLIKLTVHTGVDDAVSASQAYTESCSVATNTRLCICVPTVTPGIYNGWAKIGPSTGSEKSLPNVDELTFAVVRIDSFTFCPVR